MRVQSEGAQGSAEPQHLDEEFFGMPVLGEKDLAPLRQIFLSQHGHPEELFVEMLRLGGALCTFALDAHPRSLPRYDHMNLTDSFESLDRQIRTLLEFMIPTNCLSIPLSPGEQWFFEGAVTDARCLGPARWIL